MIGQNASNIRIVYHNPEIRYKWYIIGICENTVWDEGDHFELRDLEHAINQSFQAISKTEDIDYFYDLHGIVRRKIQPTSLERLFKKIETICKNVGSENVNYVFVSNEPNTSHVIHRENEQWKCTNVASVEVTECPSLGDAMDYGLNSLVTSLPTMPGRFPAVHGQFYDVTLPEY